MKRKTISRVYNDADLRRIRKSLSLDDAAPQGLVWTKSSGSSGPGRPVGTSAYVTISGYRYSRTRVRELLRTGADPGPNFQVFDEKTVYGRKKAALEQNGGTPAAPAPKPKAAPKLDGFRKLRKGMYLVDDEYLLTVTPDGDIDIAEALQ